MLDKTIRFRLIGVVILVIVSAAVLPIILDGERPAELDVNIQIEPAPVISSVKIAPLKPITSLGTNEETETEIEEASSTKDKVEIDLASKPIKNDELRAEKESGVFEPQITVKATQKSSSIAENVTSKAELPKTTSPKEPRWSVQIATFKSKENADNLVKKLIKAKYAAYSITTNSLYKVYVGPEIKREKAEQFRDRIKKEIGLKGLIVKYSEN